MDEISVDQIPGVGPARKRAFELLGIRTIRDLLLCLPKDYIDLNDARPIADAPFDVPALFKGEVVSVGKPFFTNRLSVMTARIKDESGSVACRWFNQPYLRDKLKIGDEVMLYGRMERDKAGKKYLAAPNFVSGEGIRPVYRSMPGIPPKTLAATVEKALAVMDGQWPDALPNEMRVRLELCERNYAMRNAHLPVSRFALESARRRLSFEELLLYQLALRLLRGGEKSGVVVPKDGAKGFWDALPFPPTNAQRRALDEIYADMASGRAMSRLVQGDVGCGKTAIAFGAAYAAIRAGYQVALMAPTEILAGQHLQSAEQILAPLGVKSGLLTGGMRAAARREALENIASGAWNLVIGTHALLTDTVVYQNLALVITDEQQRFGVRQRAKLSAKGMDEAAAPHVLVLSATPIPRTLSMILYGDLDLSVVDELPPGRTPVKTRIVPEDKREGMYGFLRAMFQKGRQAYIVCPLVEESETDEAASASAICETLQKGPLAGFRVALAHGKMKSEEKDAALESFRRGEIDALVSTTVIEVGVNVPNATVMVIENAERFGLSQLHQLRGRVGRGDQASWCFLMAEPNERLNLLCRTNDGFLVARKDLELRGPGELFGFRQSGASLAGPAAAIADEKLLQLSHDEAARVFRSEDNPEKRDLLALARARFEHKFDEIAMN